MLKDKERLLAKELYLHTNYTKKQIAAKLGITETTLSAWIREGGWEKIKLAHTISKDQLLSKAYEQLSKINQAIEDKGGLPDKNLADAKAVLIKEIQLLENKNNLSNFVYVMEKFLNFIIEQKPEWTYEMSQLQMKFLEKMQHEING